MPVEYFALSDQLLPAEEVALRLPRALEVLSAVRLDADVSVVATYATAAGERVEAIVIDIECDAVPSKNALGLRSPERLAILVAEQTDAPPSVLALRKDFPEEVHLNATQRGTPKWICLYLAPPRDVLRTWTGANFLRRIRWWLVQAALGTLHGADQPVEHPFFDTSWELIIPSGFADLRQQPGVQLYLTSVGAEAEKAGTLILHVGQAVPPGHHEFGVVVLDAPPALQRGRLRMPFSLGELEIDLRERGTELHPMLRDLLGALPAEGVALAGASKRLVLLVNFPIVRAVGGRAEDAQKIALIATEGRLSLGMKLGCYVLQGDRVYNHVLIGGAQPEEGNWRAVGTKAVAALRGPDPETFRKYSGVASAGPKQAVLVGVGSLGSEFLNLVLRAGWGEWSIIDPDHLKPHNLARHQGFAGHLGVPKAKVCEELGNAIFGAKTVKSALVADAADAKNTAVTELLDGSDLVVDCTTKLDYPRLASQSDRAARHASMFITPSGRDAVLMAEDAARTTRLRNLESQYYRAILHTAWGALHLERHQGTFWSGASCRDISLELPLSSVVIHAATLAERLPRAVGVDEASIVIWERDIDEGTVSTHTVVPAKGHSWNLGLLTVHSDEGLIAKLRQMRLDALPHETGGILVGYHDLNLGEIYIVDALPAPPDSAHSATHFERGIEGMPERLQDIRNRTADIVSYIGEWHSHPAGHGAVQSLDDRIQAAVLAFGMAADGLAFLQLIVGEDEVRVHGAIAKAA
jgi:hypothetical protein